ncbi:MAG: ribonuclease E/G [Candidatus Nanoarchaeia archaeon]|nr:ribonuclease E/G [Candidatus Nanoarchaeia archaeon]MDD5054463.1 ribonuclease E/G [Candidatus Nanoarchaeia archaeon]MDD5499569.1 ribonuclease E/G [Candidatus Nanoarchaeia archaeon]
MTGIKVRGIYSSAITRMLTKNKLEVSEPSDNIKNSFPKIKFLDKYDTTIHDFADKSGIVIKGEQTEKIKKLLEKYDNAIFQIENSGDLYLGKIMKLDPDTKNIHVDLGLKKIGMLPLKDYWGFVKEGEKILVQLKNEQKDHMVLSTKIHLFGEDMVLIQKGFTKISSSVNDKESIERLTRIAEENCMEGWGVLYKSSACDKKDAELSKQIKDLYKDYDKLKAEFEKGKEIKVLRKGMMTCYARFDKSLKEEMDKLRSEVKPTLKNHHSLKTDSFSNIVDFSENLLKEKINEEKINKTMKNFVESKSAKEEDLYIINEHKVTGITNFSKGKIIEKSNDSLKIKKFLRNGSIIPGINMSSEKGDYLITALKENELYSKNELYSANDEKKAEYYLITTPIEIHSRKAEMVCLDLTISFANDKKEIINEELIQNHANQGLISKKLAAESIKLAKKLLKGE